MSQRKMVSHNGVRMSDHGGMGAGGGTNYAGGSPGFYAPGSPKGGSVVKAPEGKPAGVPGLGGNPMQGQPGHSIPSQPDLGDRNTVGGRPKTAKPGTNYAGGTPGFYEPGGPGHGSPQPFPGNGGRPAPRPMPGRGGRRPAPGIGDGNTVGTPIYDPSKNIKQTGGKRRSVASRRYSDYQR